MITNIEKIPDELRMLVEAGLTNALTRGSLGQAKIDFIQIENSLSGGKTGAAVFVARYGIAESAYIRVLKIAPKEECESENEGYVKTRETLLDIFSQVEYYPEDEFAFNDTRYEKRGEYIQHGILLYQDVGTVAASDLKGVARYFTGRIATLANEEEDAEKFARELSLLLQKEVFLSLKKGLYGNLQRKEVNLIDYYGDKINSPKVKDSLSALRELDSSLPDPETIVNYFNHNATYHQVSYIHGDLNPENVLVWENERGFLSCKLIDFGEVIPKKKENFTPLFWDFSRLLGEMILNFVEETVIAQVDKNLDVETINLPAKLSYSISKTLNEFWLVVEAFFRDDPSKLENANSRIEFISRIYLSTLFDFINEAKSGIKDLRRAEVMQDYFYCQISFFLFYAKFGRENIYKRLFSVKLALKFYEFVNSGELALQSLIHSLEKFYFTFSATNTKNKQPQIGPAVGARSPFMGLSYFEEKDKEFFFGREAFTKELLKAIEEKQIIALAGPSGSGKSSVVHAGVIPILRSKNYLVYKFRPGKNPLQALIHALDRRTAIRQSSTDLRELIRAILSQNPDKKFFLLGDQFEELFTLTKDDREREELGNAILDCAKEHKERFRFFITIRADFWSRLLEEVSFASVVGDSGANHALGERFFLSPMSVDELRSAIEKPLEATRLKIQEGLTDLILTSISKEPGSLPLLEFCLQELWSRQIDYTLQYNSYKEIGEVKGALAAYADQVYESLNESEKDLLKKIMLQLVQPGQGTEDTRRVALMEEVISGGDDFIYKIADKRLIVTGTNSEGKQTIEVVHEALIRGWGRLREWINADREFRVWQEKIRYAVTEWELIEKENELLLHGSSVATAEEWYNARKNDLSQREAEFIEVSAKAHHAKRLRKAAEEAKAKKTLRQIAIGSVAAAILGIALSVFSYFQIKESEANEYESQSWTASAMLATNDNYFEGYYYALQAGLRALDFSDKPQANAIKFNLLSFIHGFQKPKVYQKAKEGNNYQVPTNLPSGDSPVYAVAISPKDGLLATGTKDGLIRLWKPSAIGGYQLLKVLEGHKDSVRSIAFSRDGQKIASGYGDSIIKIWKLDDKDEFHFLQDLTGHTGEVLSLAFNPDGNHLVSSGGGNGDNTIRIWEETDTGKFNFRKPLTDHSNHVWSIAFSPNGNRLASGSSDKSIRIWDSSKSGDYRLIQTLPNIADEVTSIAFSPDGRILASGLLDKTIKLWNVDTNYQNLKTITTAHEGGLKSIAFSPDGKILASASIDDTIKLFSLESDYKEMRTLTGHNDYVLSIGFSNDGKVLVSGSDDTYVKLWNIKEKGDDRELVTYRANTQLTSLALHPNGKTIAAAGSQDSIIKIWDKEDLDYKESKFLMNHIGGITGISFSPNGNLFVSASFDKTVKVWDSTPTGDFALLQTITGFSGEVSNAVFNPDGDILVTSSTDNSIKIWDSTDSKNFQLLQPISSDGVTKIVFSPSGKKLAVVTASRKKIEIWDSSKKRNFQLIETISDITEPINSIAFSPEGKVLAVGTVDIILYDMNNYSVLQTLNIGNQFDVHDIDFSPNGKMLAAAIGDGKIKLWNRIGKKLDDLPQVTGHIGGVYHVAFSPDSMFLYSSSDDGTVKRVNMDLQSVIAHSCQDLMPYFASLNSKNKPSYTFEEKDKKFCEKIIKQQSAYFKEVKNYQYYSLVYKGEIERAITLNPNLPTAYVYKSVEDTFSENTKVDNTDNNPDFQTSLKLAVDKKEIVYFERGYANFNKIFSLKYPEDKDPQKEKKIKEYDDKRNQLYEKAIADYKQALAIQPNYPRAKSALNFAEINFSRELIWDYINKEKDGFFQRALEVRKDNQEEIYFFRGAIYSDKINSDPSFIEPVDNDPQREKKKKEIQDKKISLYDKAISDYKKAVEIKADNFYLSELNSIQANHHKFLGDISRSNNDYLKAIEEYTKAIEFNSTDAVSFNNRGYSYHESKEYVKAIEDYTKAIELIPLEALYYDNRGYSYHANEEYLKAIEDYTKAIELDPNNIVYYINRGNSYKENNEYIKAIADYTYAIKLKPEETDYYIKRANAYDAINEREKAIQDFTKAIDDYTLAIRIKPEEADYYNLRALAFDANNEHDKAIQDFTKAIKLKSNNAVYYYNRAESHHVNRQFVNAIEDYTIAIKLQSDEILYYNQRGNSYHENKKYAKAIEDYTKAIELNPNNIVYYINRGNSYHENKKYAKAIEDFTKAIELNPNNIIYYVNRGNSYYANKEYIKSIEDFTTAIQLNPKNEDYYNYRGNSYNGNEEYAKAIEDFTKAMRYKSGESYYYFNRGYSYFSKKEYSKAIQDYTKAIELKSDDADYYIERGNTYYANKDYTKAMLDYTKAIELNSEGSSYYRNRANSYLKLRDYSKAIQDINTAVELNPKEADNYYYLGVISHFNKDYKTAINYYNKAIQLFPTGAVYYKNRGEAYSTINDSIKANEDYAKAISLYEQAISNDFQKFSNFFNLAEILFIQNRKETAMKKLDKAFDRKPEDQESLMLMWFLRYAHQPEWRLQSEKEIIALLKKGEVASFTILDPTVQVAIENKHPDPERLKKLAKVVTGDLPIESLEK